MTAATAGRAFDAIVLGAGANGLVAAAALGQAGRRVLLLDSAGDVGEECVPREFAPGFRSASLSLDAGWLPATVTRGLSLAVPPMVEPLYAMSVESGGGEFLSVARDPARAAPVIRRHSPRDADRWPRFVADLRGLARFLEALYQVAPPDIDATSVGEVATLLGMGRKFRALGREGMTDLLRVLPMPIQDMLDDNLECDALKAGVAAGGVRDLRQGPRSGGTAFVLLHHLVGAPTGSIRERSWWRDGPDAFCLAATAAAKRSGVTTRTGARVARVLVADDAVVGIVLASGEEIRGRCVVSTLDPRRTLSELIDPVWLDPEFLLAVRNIKYRGCVAIVEYALDGLPTFGGLEDPSGTLAGVVSLTSTTAALERAADAAKYGAVAERPHVELTVPTLRWPALAPPGKHVLVARVHYAPYALKDGAWDDARASRLADRATTAIREVSSDFGERVLSRRVLTPPEIEAQYGITEGASTHGALMLDQILFMRPVPGWGRYAMPIPGLYLGGAGAHPGPGVVGGAGWLAAQRILADAKRPKRAGVSR